MMKPGSESIDVEVFGQEWTIDAVDLGDGEVEIVGVYTDPHENICGPVGQADLWDVLENAAKAHFARRNEPESDADRDCREYHEANNA